MICEIEKGPGNDIKRSFYIPINTHSDLDPNQTIDSVNQFENNCLWNDLHTLLQGDAFAGTLGMVMVSEKSLNLACCLITNKVDRRQCVKNTRVRKDIK